MASRDGRGPTRQHLGNKEYYGNGAFDSVLWAPNNQRWYTDDWGEARVVVLDSEQVTAPGSPQYAFADAALSQAAPRTFTIVVIADPPYSSTSRGSSALTVRADLCPLFEQRGVHLVVSGNAHNYERMHPLRHGAPAAGGPVYLVSGGVGNGLNRFVLPQPAWSAVRAATYEHLSVEVPPATLAVSVIGVDGRVLDRLTIPAGP